MSNDIDRITRAHEWIVSKFGSWGAIPLRLIVGYGFMEHGYAKIAKGPEHFVGILHAIGVPAPEFMSWATIVIELAGGLAVLVGAFVPWVSVPMAAVLLVAAFTVHLPYGFSSIKLQTITAAGTQFGQPGYETDLLYLACWPLSFWGLRTVRGGQTARGLRVARQINSGMCHINAPTVHDEAQMQFGGLKGSGSRKSDSLFVGVQWQQMESGATRVNREQRACRQLRSHLF